MPLLVFSPTSIDVQKLKWCSSALVGVFTNKTHNELKKTNEERPQR
jgi:hypothetical protein